MDVDNVASVSKDEESANEIKVEQPLLDTVEPEVNYEVKSAPEEDEETEMEEEPSVKQESEDKPTKKDDVSKPNEIVCVFGSVEPLRIIFLHLNFPAIVNGFPRFDICLIYFIDTLLHMDNLLLKFIQFRRVPLFL